MYRLTVDMQVRLAADGREALARRFDNNLSPYLGRLGKEFPKRDLWNERRLAFPPGVRHEGGRRRRPPSAEKSGATSGQPTTPLDEAAVDAACSAILCAPRVRAECGVVVDKVEKELGVGEPFTTAICPEFRSSGEGPPLLRLRHTRRAMHTAGQDCFKPKSPDRKTLPERAFADIMYRLTVELQGPAGGRRASGTRERFAGGLGGYLDDLGTWHAGTDIWTDRRLASFHEFIMREVIDLIGWDLRNNSKAENGRPTRPLVRTEVRRSWEAVMGSPRSGPSAGSMSTRSRRC
jgi:hypothetical protein